MSETNKSKCPECEAELPASVPRGLCPACLLKRGLEANTAGYTAEGTPARWTPPGVEELAARFPELEITRLVGRGGMGAVYQARQKELDRLVALKILPPEIGRDPSFAQRFAREAQAMAKLSHPNIVTIHDFGQRGGLYFFVMEYVDGLNLRQLLDAGTVSPKEALAIVPQICDALQYAHDRGIVHRDIKPENILLNREGLVKIADFGLAKLVGRNPADATAVGEKVMGTPHYMAPEQTEHPGEVDHRADIYSLGVVFYQMLTGELPLGKFEPPSRKVLIDVRLDEVVLRALEKEPSRRYQQASEVKTVVETIVGSDAAGRHSRANAPSAELPGVVVLLIRVIYALAVLLAMWPFLGLGMNPKDPRHVERFVFCALISVAIAFVGGFLSLLANFVAKRLNAGRPSPGGRVVPISRAKVIVVVAGLLGGAYLSGLAIDHLWEKSHAHSVSSAQPKLQPAAEPARSRERAALLPARTFNSDLSLEVWIRRTADGPLERIGRTPSTQPIQIPTCYAWWVWERHSVDIARLRAELKAKDIPGLWLNFATDGDLEQLRGMAGLRFLNLRYTRVTDAGLEHLKTIPGLQDLELQGDHITDAGLAHLKDLTGLTGLGLWHTAITDSGLAHLEIMTGLERLDLGDTEIKITGKGLVHLKGLTGLLSLDLTGASISVAGLENLEGLTELKRLNLSWTPITDVGLEYLAGLKGLNDLSLGNTKITDAGLDSLKGLIGLQRLSLAGTQITDAGLGRLKHLTGLQSIALDGTKISDAGLAQLKGLTGLKVLNLWNTPITSAGLEHLGGLSGLQNLTLGYTQITDGGLVHLKSLRELQELVLTRTKIADADLAQLAGLTKLKELDLRDTAITDAGLEHLKGLARLENLELAETKIMGAGLEHLEGLTRLETLDLDKTKVTGEGLVYLKGLRELKDLDLSHTEVDDAGLAYLNGLTGLETLRLGGNKIGDAGLKCLECLKGLRYLSLGGTKITDAGLVHLEALTGMQSLDLMDTQVTDAGLVHLKGLTGLRFLAVGEEITEAGVNALRTALPFTQIEWGYVTRMFQPLRRRE